MIYNNTAVRRQDRLLAEGEALELIRKAAYGILSLVSGKQPYGVPLNYVWNGEDYIYFHAACEGKNSG